MTEIMGTCEKCNRNSWLTLFNFGKGEVLACPDCIGTHQEEKAIEAAERELLEQQRREE